LNKELTNKTLSTKHFPNAAKTECICISDVTIVFFSLSIQFQFNFYEEFDVNFDFFAPIFVVEDINSSALGMIGFGDINSPKLGLIKLTGV